MDLQELTLTNMVHPKGHQTNITIKCIYKNILIVSTNEIGRITCSFLKVFAIDRRRIPIGHADSSEPRSRRPCVARFARFAAGGGGAVVGTLGLWESQCQVPKKLGTLVWRLTSFSFALARSEVPFARKATSWVLYQDVFTLFKADFGE